MQGRADRQDYRSAMNRCRNAIPLEEGGASARPGTRVLSPTRNGGPAALKAFSFSQDAPYLLELTGGHIRFFARTSLVLEMSHFDVTDVSSGTPAEITTSAAHGYDTGDQVVFTLPEGWFLGFAKDLAPLLGKVFFINVTGADTFTAIDSATGIPLNGGSINFTADNPVQVTKVYDLVAPYNESQLGTVRTAQDETELLTFHRDVRPYILTGSAAQGTDLFASFSYDAADLIDGPYMDPPEDGSTLTPGGTSGTITLAETGSFYSFVSTDIGRMMRLFSEPEDWDAGTAFAEGDAAKYDDTYWTALKATTGGIPGVDLEAWAVDPSAARWTWGFISAVNSASSVDVTLAAEDPAGVKAGGDLLYMTDIKAWRLGVYSVTTGWPTCGCFYEGRLVLGSVIGNRLDTSMSNKTLDFSPTLRDGTVADNCGISATFRSDGVNRPLWMTSSAVGIIIGTQAGEWMVRASQLNDPLTPTSIQVHSPTKFGGEFIEVLPLPMATAFVQRGSTKLIELTETYPPKYLTGQDISRDAKHFWSEKVEELAYQALPTPIIWARTSEGNLLGCTYRRDSQFSNQPVSFAGWHRHTLGTARKVMAVQVGPSADGNSDTLSMVTHDTVNDVHYIEQLTSIFPEDGDLVDAWQLDGGFIPAAADLIDGTEVGTGDPSGITYIRFYGLEAITGESVTAWIAGVDAGDHVVGAQVNDDTGPGMVDIPIDQAGSLLTSALLASVSQQGGWAYTTTIMPVGGLGSSQDITAPFAATAFTVMAWETDVYGERGPTQKWFRTQEFGVSYDKPPAITEQADALGVFWNDGGTLTAKPTGSSDTTPFFVGQPAGAFGWVDATVPAMACPHWSVSATFTAQLVFEPGHDFEYIPPHGISDAASDCALNVDIVRVNEGTITDMGVPNWDAGTIIDIYTGSNVLISYPLFLRTTDPVDYIYGFTSGGTGTIGEEATRRRYVLGADKETWTYTGPAPVLQAGDEISVAVRAMPRGYDARGTGLDYAPLGATIDSFAVRFIEGCGSGGLSLYEVPAQLGSAYDVECQIVRPVAPQESGAANGPAFAKTRRAHEFGVLLLNTQGISFGTDFTNMRPAEFRTPGGTAYADTSLFSGTYEGTVEDDYSFDSMLCWSVSRPFPATVLSIGGFLKTQDR